MTALDWKISLNRIWSLRNRGLVSEALEAYMKLNAQPDLEDLQGQGHTFEESLSYCLLEVSFLRNQLRLNEAHSVLKKLEDQAAKHRPNDHFALVAQKALNSFASGNFVHAFDSFVRARQLANTPEDQTWVLYNLILAMEEIGADASASVDAFSVAVPRLSDEWKEFLGTKAYALKIRESFRKGRLEALNDLSTKSLDDYSLYFLSWLAQIPYLEEPQDSPYFGRVLSVYTKKGAEWLSGYRLRTHQGLLIAADLEAGLPLREAVERLYLWTWRWLVQPSSDGLERLLTVKQHLAPSTDRVLSPEHHQMLRNSFRWLGVFSGKPESEIEKEVAEYQRPCHPGSLFLDFEALLQSYLLSLRKTFDPVSKDTWIFLQNHPAANTSGFKLPELALAFSKNAKPPARMQILGQSLNRLFFTPGRKLQNGFVIAAAERKIRTIASGECIAENPQNALVSLCLLVQEKPGFTKQELLRYCYGLPRYDAYVHDSKVANLISSANRFFAGVLRFSAKGDRVTSKLLSPEKLQIVDDCVHSRLLAGSTIDSMSPPQRSPSPKPLRLEHLCNQWIARNEFEKLLGVSKATTTRRLKEWKKRNLVQCRGKGRGSKYLLQPNLIEKFEKEGALNG